MTTEHCAGCSGWASHGPNDEGVACPGHTVSVSEAVSVIQRNIRQGKVTPQQVVDILSDFANVGFGREMDELANAVASDHPTLIGQISKAIGLGVMRRTLGDAWKPFQRTFFDSGEARREGFAEPDYLVRGRCSGSVGVHPLTGGAITPRPDHPDHDGRLDCDTIVGAELLTHQSFI